MRINIAMGFFLPVPPVAGGATEKIWFRLAREFAAQGHVVTLLSRRWPGFPTDETQAGVRLLRLPGWDHTRRLWLNLLLDGRWGWRLLRRLPPGDVVVCNTVSLPVYLRRFKPSAGKVAVVLGRMPKGQTRWYRGVDLVLAPSEGVAVAARVENSRLAGRVRVFPNPIDWTLHAHMAQKTAPLTIGYVGRIHPEKGLELLLEAAARLTADLSLPPWRVQLVGPVEVAQGGGGADFRDQLAATYGPRLSDRLQILPPEFDPVRLAASYGRMDVFCYPSIAERGETFGVAVAEAMAAAAVPVVSDLAVFRDLVRTDCNGLVFDHHTPDAAGRLASLLARLLTDQPLRATLAHQAQADAKAYDYAEAARNLLLQFARLTDATTGR